MEACARAQDVLEALALGAKGCLIGKGAFLYALAAPREAGRHARARHHAQGASPSVSRSTGANDVSATVTPEILVPRR